MKRVVVTGMSSITSLGHDWETFSSQLRDKQSGIRYMTEWDEYEGLNTRLGGPVLDFETPSHYTRRQLRSMGRVAVLSTRAAELALENAGLLGDPIVQSGELGVSFGSSSGTPSAVGDFGNMLINKRTDGLNATTYIKMMSHTSPVNIGVFFGAKGRVITTSSACTSGSQGIGYAYEAIQSGKQKVMIAGGAEEQCATQSAVFDTLFATSLMNKDPQRSPRPFDKDRDGLVIGEGAGVLILEEYEFAKARGANILAELVGFGTNSDGKHITSPSKETMEVAMNLALADANLPASEIGFVCAHGTATEQGDIAETQATLAAFGNNIPITSLKGYLGHTLGACGAIEAWATIHMLNNDWYAANMNLDNVDERCGDLDYIVGSGREMKNEYVMSNNFAFGGINTSLIFKRYS
ncbi:beta-ketoacyl-ACP synthase II [Gammaproteobacteria bacterium 45_16_T64]|nr:beta-ketoacyl-ACP synthase II [Gammaproteobacteria bacterium 45_16_T64]